MKYFLLTLVNRFLHWQSFEIFDKLFLPAPVLLVWVQRHVRVGVSTLQTKYISISNIFWI